MFIQGDLQVVFDALFAVGAIDPVLKMDWEEINRDMVTNQETLRSAFETVNKCLGNKNELIQTFSRLDDKSLSYIAMEVAREFAEFQDRKDLH